MLGGQELLLAVGQHANQESGKWLGVGVVWRELNTW